MANITQALVDATTDMTVAGVSVDVDTRRITDSSGTTTTFDDGTVADYDVAIFALNETEMTGTSFEGCVIHPTISVEQDGMRFSGFPDFDDCTFIHTAGRPTMVWGNYGPGRGAIGGNVNNCRWAAIGNSGTTPREWSVNLSLHTGVVTNPTFEGCWIGIPGNGALNFGWTLDGTVRNEGRSRARWSAQVRLDTGVTWTAFINSRFNNNGEYSSTASDYASIIDTAAGAHLSSDRRRAAIDDPVDNVYTINTTFENWDTSTDGQETYVVIANNGLNGVGSVFRDGYLWNPRFIESGTVMTPITDAKILFATGLPVTPFTLDLTDFEQNALLPAFDGGLWNSTAGDVLFMQCGMGTTVASTVDVATPVTVPKALNENGGVRPQFVVQPRVKSYTHVSSEVTTGLDVVQAYSGGVNGDITMRTSSDSFFPVDAALNSVAYADAMGVATTADQIYPFLKRVWYDTETDVADEDFQLSAGGSILTIDRRLNIGVVPTYASESYTLNTAGGTLTSGATITSLVFMHADAVSLATYDADSFAAFTGDRFTDIPAGLNNISLTQTGTGTSDIAVGTYDNVQFAGTGTWNLADGLYTFNTGTSFATAPTGTSVSYRGTATDAELFPGGTVPTGFTRFIDPTTVTVPLDGNFVAVGADGTVGPPMPITGGSPINFRTLELTLTAPVDVYYKPTNTYVTNGASLIYDVQKLNAVSDGDANPPDISSEPTAQILVGLLPDLPSGYTRTMSIVGSRATATYLYDPATANTNFDQQTSKRFMLDITDTGIYLQAVAGNGTVGSGVAPQGIIPGQRETTVNGNIISITNSVGEVNLSNIATTGTMAVVDPIPATIAGGVMVDFRPFILGLVPGISGAEVTDSCNTALLAQNLDTVAGKVNNIEKVSGWQASDGDATNPQITNRSRLSGIQPKVANFDNDAPYEQIFADD